MNEQSAVPQLAALVVTYRRTEAISKMLEALQQQTRQVDILVIVDNGSDLRVADLASRVGAIYVDPGKNVGPAGGIAAGVERLQAELRASDWLLLLDDDDPPTRNDLIDCLWRFAGAMRESDSRVGGVGLVGARYDPRPGTLIRVGDNELSGPVAVDYIGGGQFPLYLWQAIREAGPPESSLFFGFDDLEFGLRLRQSSFNLYAHGDLWRSERQKYGRLQLDRKSLNTPKTAPAWRRYYAARNITLIARKYGEPLAPMRVAVSSAVGGAASLVRARRPIREALLPIRGAIDGLIGNVGKTVEPW